MSLSLEKQHLFFFFHLLRVCECEDLEMSESEAAKLVASIEMEMFDIFRNTDSKYMNKYRTIMFNLKDPRNKVCWNLLTPILVYVHININQIDNLLLYVF